MSIDAMKQALAALNDYEPNEAHKVATALRAAIEQAKPISNPDGLNQELLEALKELLRCPAGDYDTTDDYENAVKRARAAIEQARLEQHEKAMKDAIIGGTGVMLGNKRIDPASIYKQPEQDPRRWEDQETCHCDSPTWCKHYNKCNRKMLGLPPAPRQWQGLTDDERNQFRQWAHPEIIDAIELKLRERNP